MGATHKLNTAAQPTHAPSSQIWRHLRGIKQVFICGKHCYSKETIDRLQLCIKHYVLLRELKEHLNHISALDKYSSLTEMHCVICWEQKVLTMLSGNIIKCCVLLLYLFILGSLYFLFFQQPSTLSKYLSLAHFSRMFHLFNILMKILKKMF